MDNGKVHQCAGVVTAAFEYVSADNRQVAERPLVVVEVGDLIIGDECHQIDVVQALYSFEAGESAAAVQVVVRNHHDFTDELSILEAGAYAFQQCLPVSSRQCGLLTLRLREKRQANSQWDLQLGDLILHRRRSAIGIEKVNETGRVTQFSAALGGAPHALECCASGQTEGGDGDESDSCGCHGESVSDAIGGESR